MKSNVSLQVIPSTENEEDLYPIVDKVIELIEDSGVKYRVGPMETTMEGQLDELLQIVKEAQHICKKHGARRVLSVVKIDYKPGGVTMDEKMKRHE